MVPDCNCKQQLANSELSSLDMKIVGNDQVSRTPGVVVEIDPRYVSDLVSRSQATVHSLETGHTKHS